MTQTRDAANSKAMNAKIKLYIDHLDTSVLSDDRKEVLTFLKEYIVGKKATKEPILLNYICTHNSRRSHLGQVWGQTMAHHFDVENVTTYSGGTEETEIYKSVLTTLEDIGFDIGRIEDRINPVYAISYDDDADPIVAFSKKYDDDYNPTSGFVAIMTCSSADEGCPIVSGSEKRFAITYDDPKVSDGSLQEKAIYAARCKQIATEMKFVFE